MTCLFGSQILVNASRLLTNRKNSHILPQKFNRNSVKFNITLTNKCYSTSSDVSSFQLSSLEHETSKLDNTSDELFSSAGLVREAMPKHIAICLDGTRRWYKARGRDTDYRPFFEKAKLFNNLCLQWGIPNASIYIYGIVNFQKRGEEANKLFLGQFQTHLEDNLEYFVRNGVKVVVMGETSLLSNPLQEIIRIVEKETRNNTKLELSLPTCYSGQWDITKATRKICEKVKQGVIKPCDVTEDMIEKGLAYTYPSTPDLFIRTGGELRIGALLTWHVAHIELYFTDTLAPDFDEVLFLDALRSYQTRTRKFGK